jgi:hypothetical protein
MSTLVLAICAKRDFFGRRKKFFCNRQSGAFFCRRDIQADCGKDNVRKVENAKLWGF